jgi:hypothetical protein
MRICRGHFVFDWEVSFAELGKRFLKVNVEICEYRFFVKPSGHCAQRLYVLIT